MTDGGDELQKAVYNAAYFWHLNPFDLMELPLPDLFELLHHQQRITNELNAQYGRH